MQHALIVRNSTILYVYKTYIVCVTASPSSLLVSQLIRWEFTEKVDQSSTFANFRNKLQRVTYILQLDSVTQ